MNLNQIVNNLEELLSYLNDYNCEHYPDAQSAEAIELEGAYARIRAGKEIIEDFIG